MGTGSQSCVLNKTRREQHLSYIVRLFFIYASAPAFICKSQRHPNKKYPASVLLRHTDQCLYPGCLKWFTLWISTIKLENLKIYTLNIFFKFYLKFNKKKNRVLNLKYWKSKQWILKNVCACVCEFILKIQWLKFRDNTTITVFSNFIFRHLNSQSDDIKSSTQSAQGLVKKFDQTESSEC